MPNRTNASAWLMGLALSLAPGCYTGIQDGPPARSDGAGGGPEGGDDEGEPAPGDSGEPGADAPFHLPTDEARLLPFPVRMANLAHVAGEDVEHPMFAELYALRYQLGDHHFATGVASDLRWSADKMQHWVRGLEPVCSSAEMRGAYPELLTDPRPLMRRAWGHEPAAEQVEAVTDLQDGTVPAEQQFMVTCIAVLTALDFVAI